MWVENSSNSLNEPHFLFPHFHSAKNGYAVYKSVPYGTVDDTLPYLVRRAQENRTVLQGIRKERDLLRSEFYRRLSLRKANS